MTAPGSYGLFMLGAMLSNLRIVIIFLKNYFYHPQFTVEETEVQGGLKMCPRSHGS